MNNADVRFFQVLITSTFLAFKYLTIVYCLTLTVGEIQDLQARTCVHHQSSLIIRIFQPVLYHAEPKYVISSNKDDSELPVT